MTRQRQISVEAPDDKIVVDFLSRGVSVTLEIVLPQRKKDRPQLYVLAKGCDDRASILIDTLVEIPEEDKRS